VRSRLRIAAAALWIVLAASTSVVATQRAQVSAPLEMDCATRLDRVFARLRPFLPEEGVVGFVGPETVYGCNPMFVAQYSLAPVYVTEQEWRDGRVSMRGRAEHVLPPDPPLVLLWGEEGRGWLAEHPHFELVARASAEVSLVAESQ